MAEPERLCPADVLTGRNLHRNEKMQLLTRFPPLENLKSIEWMWWPLLRAGPPDLWTVSAGIDAGLLRQE